MACRLFALPFDVLAVVLRKLSARSLARLACACRQLQPACLTVAERAVEEILAAGEQDAPLPTSLARLETVYHRLARLCGIRRAPIRFIDTLMHRFSRNISWDLAAVEKLHVVLSHCRTAEAQSPRGKTVDLPIDEDAALYQRVVENAIDYSYHNRQCFGRGQQIVRREHVDQAISSLWSARGPRIMKRTRALLEEHDAEEHGAVDDEDPDYEATEEEDDDGEVDLKELIDGGADAVGVRINGEWYPSLSCALNLGDNHLHLDEHFGDPEEEDPEAGCVFDFRPVGQWTSSGCTNPLCCHTRLNCRLVSGEMLAQFWPGADAPEQRPHFVLQRGTASIRYEPAHIDRLARVPTTGRLQPLACPRAKRHREEFAYFRKHRRAELEHLVDSIEEGVRFGDVVDSGNFVA